MKKYILLTALALGAATPAMAGGSDGDDGNPRTHSCDGLPNWSQLQTALKAAVAVGPNATTGNGGLGFNMWATVVAKDGTVCAVAYSGNTYADQWLASRVISAQKANTASGLSLSDNGPPAASLFPTGLALSTANLYSAVQPGGSLYGLQFSNPVDPTDAYLQRNGAPDDPNTYGTARDPMVGRPIGGVNVFGGGLGLYLHGQRVGGVGVSGDQSCTDHFTAWRVRHLLKTSGGLAYDNLYNVKGVSGDPQRPDNIVYDIKANPYGGTGISAGGFGHPPCVNYNANPGSLPAANLNP
ncbi:MAG: hypothetical protein ACLPSF_07275 [Methylocella sp.]